MQELDWPVERGGAVIVSDDGDEAVLRPGTDTDDRFAIASVTKLLTSLAALVAVESGHLGLDDTVDVRSWAPGREVSWDGEITGGCPAVRRT